MKKPRSTPIQRKPVAHGSPLMARKRPLRPSSGGFRRVDTATLVPLESPVSLSEPSGADTHPEILRGARNDNRWVRAPLYRLRGATGGS